MNPTAVIAINLALVFYTIGVWAERFQGKVESLAHGPLLDGTGVRHMGDDFDV